MAATNDYVVPHLDGLPYLDKPVALLRRRRASPWRRSAPARPRRACPRSSPRSRRSPSSSGSPAVAGGMTAGWLAGLALATMPMVAAYARTTIFDSTPFLIHYRRHRVLRRGTPGPRLGGDRRRRAHQGTDRDPHPPRGPDPLRPAHRPPAAAPVPVARAAGLRARGPAVVLRRDGPDPRIPALRLRARDLRAGDDAELPPHGAVLVLPPDPPRRRLPVDRAGAVAPPGRRRALGLARTHGERQRPRAAAARRLGAGPVGVLHAQPVEAAAVRAAAHARDCPGRRPEPDAHGGEPAGGSAYVACAVAFAAALGSVTLWLPHSDPAHGGRARGDSLRGPGARRGAARLGGARGAGAPAARASASPPPDTPSW